MPSSRPGAPAARLLQIREVAAELGLTPRSIRYYEEIGLLEPAARSEGAYRLYDADDLTRLRAIKGFRDDAGFSLAEIAQLLEDEDARDRNRVRFRSTQDSAERRAILLEGIQRVDRQIGTLRTKIERLEAMAAVAGALRRHLAEHLAGIEHEAVADARPDATAHAEADSEAKGR